MRDFEIATLAANACGLDHFVRTPATDYATIMRPLEAGANGVMVSMVRSPEEAETAVRWAKFWPRGERGVNGGNRDGQFGLMPYDRVHQRGQRPHLRGHPDRDGPGAGRRGRDRRNPRRRPDFRRPGRPQPGPRSAGDWENPRCLAAIEGIAQACKQRASPGASCPEGPSTPNECEPGAARCSSWASTTRPSTQEFAPPRNATDPSSPPDWPIVRTSRAWNKAAPECSSQGS